MTFGCHWGVTMLSASLPSRPVMPFPALSNRLSAALDHAAAAGDRSAAHLAGFSFRLASAAQDGAEDPAAGPWSLARTLSTLRARGATLVATDRGVRLVRAGRPPAALTRALDAHGASLRAALRLGVLDYSAPSPWSAGEWDDETRLHAAWFGLEFSPVGSVEVSTGVRVAELGRLRESVARRLVAGPAAVGARRLAEDLASLYARFGPAAGRVHAMPRTHAMAA